ncbi:MAG: arginine deiminase-related protein [Gammaproteobacteria bacterium]|nr:arginine deiminase-related protein [Gammaproteobacteria bacterium]
MTAATETQLASAVLMIRPVRFESNPLTAASNRFQGKTQATSDEQQDAAKREFDGLVDALRDNDVDVVVVEDTHEPHTPDSIFPNNWVSFHADGSVVLYPMEAENRRTERRLDIIEKLDSDFGYAVREIVDLSHHEQSGHFLEGTGSMVLDRVNRVAYACLSTRTHLDALGDFAQRMGYEVVAFDAVDRNGVAIYHTNVLMNVGEKLAVIGDVAISREEQRAAVLQRLTDTGHTIISLSYDQIEVFAGNMLELRKKNGGRLTAMSQQAFDSLTDEQLSLLQQNGTVLPIDIGVIEAAAGGSVRCMLAEIHLPRD